jgi:hypothetical protein
MRRFTLTATPAADGGRAVELGGVFWQRALLPWWLPLLLALALAAAAAALLVGGDTDRTAAPTPTAEATVSPTAPAEEPRVTAQPEVTVPNVTGRSLARARDRLEARGLELGTVRPKGLPDTALVADQDPAAGGDVAEGTTVDVTLAATEVPDLDGLTLAEARERLEAEGLAEGAVTPWDAGEDWTVRRQRPAAGDEAPDGAEVDLTLAEPPPPEFGESDALDIAEQGASIYAGSMPGVIGAAVDACASSGGDRWTCSGTLDYVAADASEQRCPIVIDVVAAPNDIAALESGSGLYGTYDVDDSACVGG